MCEQQAGVSRMASEGKWDKQPGHGEVRGGRTPGAENSNQKSYGVREFTALQEQKKKNGMQRLNRESPADA